MSSTIYPTTIARTREDYAGLIRADLQKSVERVIAAGRHLIEAQDKLEHGDWLKMIENDLPFGKNTAQRLMKIAKHLVLSNAAHAPLSPTSWSTLYELTKLPDKKLQAKLIDGTITAETERKDIAKLKAKGTKRVSPTPVPKPKPLTAFEELHQEVMRLRERLVAEVRNDPDVVKGHGPDIAAIVEEAEDRALFAELAAEEEEAPRAPIAAAREQHRTDPTDIIPENAVGGADRRRRRLAGDARLPEPPRSVRG